MKGKMLEAKFQEEKLRLQQKHDTTVQKVNFVISPTVSEELSNLSSHHSVCVWVWLVGFRPQGKVLGRLGNSGSQKFGNSTEEVRRYVFEGLYWVRYFEQSLSWRKFFTSDIQNLFPSPRNVFTGMCRSVHNRPHGYLFTVHPYYGMVGTHPTGMLSCWKYVSGDSEQLIFLFLFSWWG